MKTVQSHLQLRKLFHKPNGRACLQRNAQ